MWGAAQSVSGAKGMATASSKVVAHPVPLKVDTQATTCLECHGDLQQGKYVHSVMPEGCKTCHKIETAGGVTRVTLVAPAVHLCESCHALVTAKVLHGPYKEGLCVTCHSPHSSNFPAHTWASTQDICLGCHTRARLKVNQKTKTASTPWGQPVTLAQMKGFQYVNLDASLTHGHPVAKHPVTGPNTSAKLAAVGCLSCHNQHASNFRNLLPVGSPPGMPDCGWCGVCQQCHGNMY
jgi:predicted CXXCH cytochrome family protein